MSTGPGSDNRADLLTEQVIQRLFGLIHQLKRLAREQLLRLVASVYPLPEDVHGHRLTGWGEELELEWSDHQRKFAQLGVRWDPLRCDYVRPDGP